MTADRAVARPGRVLHGRRRGHRLRARQRDLLARHLPALEIALPADGAALDPAALFDRPVDQLWLEIGFGAGEHLVAQALAHPEHGMIGCEPFVNGVARLVAACHDRGIGNVRVFVDDARLLIAALPAACLSRVFVLFPDPWPKRRHHKRRLLGAPLVAELARVLAVGGVLRVATDHAGFCRWALYHVLANRAFAWTARRARDWRARDPCAPATRYERKALAAGRRPVHLTFVRAAATGADARVRQDS